MLPMVPQRKEESEQSSNHSFNKYHIFPIISKGKPVFANTIFASAPIALSKQEKKSIVRIVRTSEKGYSSFCWAHCPKKLKVCVVLVCARGFRSCGQQSEQARTDCGEKAPTRSAKYDAS